MSLRPTSMRTRTRSTPARPNDRWIGPSVALAIVPLALVLTGCGQDASTGRDGRADVADPAASESGPSPSRWKDCTVAAFEDADAPVTRVGTVSSGSTGPTEIKLPTSGPCGGGLVARTGSGVSGADVSGLDLDPSTIQVVSLRGAESAALIRVDSSQHPRGGFQPHLFRVPDGQEITVDDRPLIPFVATDGGMAPMTVRCGPDGTIEVLQASTSEPPGVVLAWDVEQTTYALGDPVREVGTEQVRDHVADPVLRADLPDLFDPAALLGNC